MVRHNPKEAENPGAIKVRLRQRSNTVPLVTDIHYTPNAALVAAEFVEKVRKCKANGAAMRIGVNHGSPSSQVLNRYGDTPEGMVQSALEFIRIASGSQAPAWEP